MGLGGGDAPPDVWDASLECWGWLLPSPEHEAVSPPKDDELGIGGMSLWDSSWELGSVPTEEGEEDANPAMVPFERRLRRGTGFCSIVTLCRGPELASTFVMPLAFSTIAGIYGLRYSDKNAVLVFPLIVREFSST